MTGPHFLTFNSEEVRFLMAKSPAPFIDEPAEQAPDHVLIAAATPLHGLKHGKLRHVKVVGANVTGLNAKGQVVSTSIEIATAHATKVGPAILEPGPASDDNEPDPEPEPTV